MLDHSSLGPLLRTLALSIALGLASTGSPAAQPASPPRETIPLDAGWRFHLGDEARAAQSDFDDSSWRTLDVPHDWSIEGALCPPPMGEKNGGFFAHGLGWYRKSFPLPGMAGRKVVVEFDGVYMNSDVWINGQFLGRRPYGFIGFRYDLTEFLKTDGTPNVLAVRVDDSLEPSLRWYAGAGIYRHVRLVTTGFTHFRLDGGVRITTPKITSKKAVVEADYVIDANFFSEEERQTWLKDVWKAHPANHELVLRSAVLALDGTVVASAESKLAVEDMYPGQHATQRVTVPAPRLWSDRTPALYRLRSTVTLGGQPLDETTTTFGIRELRFDPDRGLFVNGQPTKLKGVCLHQDAGSFGNAVPMAVWAWRLARLKETGCNAIRTSHHPFAPEFYDLCDELGIYVFDEAFDEWTRDWPYNFTEDPRGKSQYGYHLYFNQWHDTDLRAMLRRDRNHPSVVLYSIGNEIPNQLDHDGAAIARRLIAICHEEDPTRPATSACDQSHVSSRNGFMDTLDIAGYNYIDREHGDLMYAPDRARFPHRLCLGTETAHTVRNWLAVRDQPYVIGEFIWTGIDYLGESHAFPRRGADSGLLDIAGGAKPQFYQFAAYWRDDPVLHLSVLTGEKAEFEWRPAVSLAKWNWPAGATVTVRAVSNCDEVELLLNDHSLGRHAISRDVYASDWTVPFAPGVLTAVGYRAGQRVSGYALHTAGAPARLLITPLESPIASDVALYEIAVVDDAGVTVMDASPAVTVRVEGAGRLIGLDTGDLNYGGLFKTDTRDAYQGRLLATVQGMAPTGGIRIVATAPGLPAATLASEAFPAAAIGGNPIVTDIFTADPEARVFGDRLYVYTSHDLPEATYWDMVDWRLLSTTDLVHWQDHGAIFSLKGFSWAKQWAWAPDCVHANGKYYLFLPVDRTKIGVAVADSPTGPFKDAIGKPLLDNRTMPEAGAEPIDPAVLVDDDGQAYLYFGCRNARVVKLDPSLTRFAGPIETVRLVDTQGKPIPVAAPDTNPVLPQGYGEAPFMFKRAGRYYFVYSNGWASESTQVYAIGDSPMGPFTYAGKVMEHAASVTQHGSVVEFRGKWYVFYHTSELSNGNSFRRSVCVDELTFAPDGKINTVTPTKTGPVPPAGFH